MLGSAPKSSLLKIYPQWEIGYVCIGNGFFVHVKHKCTAESDRTEAPSDLQTYSSMHDFVEHLIDLRGSFVTCSRTKQSKAKQSQAKPSQAKQRKRKPNQTKAEPT
jgi:hypothetical protein